MVDENIDAKETRVARKQTSEPIIVDERYQVDVMNPLPSYDMQPALAYQCSDTFNTKKACLALICDPQMPPRASELEVYQQIAHVNLQNVLYCGTVHWLPEKRHCPIMIVEHPGGERVFPSLTTVQPPLLEEDVLMRFVRPTVQIIRHMHSRHITHRAIRPPNLFYGDANKTKIVLGEPLSSPIAVTQPVVFEPSESMQSNIYGRGKGSASYDIYAFAVTVFSLLTGRIACAGMSDEEIIANRLNKGTYEVIVGKNEFSRMIIEMLIGCLDDNPYTRWRPDDLINWIGGKHFSLKARATPRVARTALAFNEKSYNSPRLLAQDMSENWQTAKSFVASGELSIWVRRYLPDSESISSANLKQHGSLEGSAISQDKLLPRALMVSLDPLGPLRYKSFCAKIDGIGSLVSLQHENKEIQEDFVGLIDSGTIALWQEHRLGQESKQYNTIINQLESIRRDIRVTRMGGGMERFRYELNPDLPCISTLFKNDYVHNIDEMLLALDRASVAEAKKLEKGIIDREIAAFIVVKTGKEFRYEFQTIESSLAPDQSRIQQIKILAQLQSESNLDLILPNLCRIACKILEPTLERFNGKSVRDRVLKKMYQTARLGNISDIVEMSDDENEFQNDEMGFNLASAEYKNINERIESLKYRIKNRSELARVAGGHVAMGVSGFLGCIIAISLIFYMQLL